MVQQIGGDAGGRAAPPPRAGVTIRDVARHAGVSAGTVSNVLNRPFYVNAATRERVMASIRALDFVPKQAARQFRPGRVRSLGIAVADLGNPFFVDVALGAEKAARAQGIGVVVSNSGHDAEQENRNLELLTQQRVQGLIISPVDETSSQIQMLRDRGVPMVFVDRVGEDPGAARSVVVDDVAGGRLAAHHVLRQGHQRVGFLGHPSRSPKVRRRLEGVRTALQDSSAELEPLETPTWTVDAGREAAEELLSRPSADRPTVLLCANDLLALGALQRLIQGGLRVPEDVAVVGYDDLEWATTAVPPLTTVRQPRHELGAAAVELMMELFEARGAGDPQGEAGGGSVGAEPKHVVLQPELIIRSTA